MLPQQRELFLEDEFGKPVESIMRCEDFKSNFARRLSNRYISRSQLSGSREDGVLKLCPTDKQEILKKVPERIELCTQLLKNNKLEQNEDIVAMDKIMKTNVDIKHTEVNALKMEVDTLRWQLAQTESNRQMHIALLKQIVTFLNRVKEHIECQKNEPEIQVDAISSFILQRSLNTISDLPRCRSDLHVSKNLDYSLTSTKKTSTRKISKSIHNVNGYKDCTSIWNQSKLSENETGQKLTEEMSRLITLANTVLSTNIPDLACASVCNRNESIFQFSEDDKKEETNMHNGVVFNVNLKNTNENNVLNSSCETNSCNGTTKKFVDIKNKILDDFIVPQSALSFGLENDSCGVKLFDQEQQCTQSELVTSCGKVHIVDKRNEYNASSNFVEDESGFSSMSSFQEIGIPIINLIPPSPSKEVEYLQEIADEAEKWKTDTIKLDEQTVKVFWV